jgi:SAM-dependent methyltransferase
MYGDHFHNESLATSPSALKEIIPKGSRVIDIGCGSGRWARVISELGCEVVGVDHSASNLELARSKGGNIKYIQFDATQEFGKLGIFDFGVLIHVLEHIENPTDLMRSLRNSCKKLVIEVPDFESDSLNWLRIKANRPYYSDADHVREYSSESIKKLVNETGWTTTYKFQKGGAQLIIVE